MKILLTHCDYIEYEKKKKAIESAEQTDTDKERIEECLVVFCSAEQGDDESVAEKTVAEIKKVAEQVHTKTIVVYPFVHLSSTPAKPAVALSIVIKIAQSLKKDYEVHRSPFGWYKSFELKCKGHPLSELSREIRSAAQEKTILVNKPEKKDPQASRGKIILDRRNLPPNDHRILGEELGIFHLSEEVGAGLPLWMPYGETLRNILIQFMRQIEEKYGYRYVSTPHITRGHLYEKTGHLPYYKDSMYAPMNIEGEEYYLKPMNCPHHHMIYNKMVESYRDLPLRLAEPGMTYRNELSGVTYGLIRVRAFTQNDSHIYMTPEQLKEEFLGVLRLFKEVYAIVGVKDYWFRLSLPDFKNNPDKYTGDPNEWAHACDEIRNAMKEFGTKFVEEEGEAAFYGPKIDVQIKNSLGKEETIATSQVDIVVPKRLGMFYIDANGDKKTPIIIHRAILGSYERFVAYLLEQTEGKLPVWLSPVQVKILSLTDRNAQRVKEIYEKLIACGVRAERDLRQNTVDYKIREAEMQKVPYTIVIGDKEEASGTLAVRARGEKPRFGVSTEEFLARITKEIENKL
ncbi:MAG TPA: threonine--tRNA ligase [Candidatus Aenigmarchaeota archaeon]|nr:threonine--tRNA ligase [Candidatus Aenigmarchaeota archaeon]